MAPALTRRPRRWTWPAAAWSRARILEALDTGLYIGNLWYLNFSDMPAARLTGMTRFATFWVENGQIQAPVSTMRFDDSLYSFLGAHLEDLSHERELRLSSNTYGERQTDSMHLPGALTGRFTSRSESHGAPRRFAARERRVQSEERPPIFRRHYHATINGPTPSSLSTLVTHARRNPPHAYPIRYTEVKLCPL